VCLFFFPSICLALFPLLHWEHGLTMAPSALGLALVSNINTREYIYVRPWKQVHEHDWFLQLITLPTLLPASTASIIYMNSCIQGT
jgi:hypothetical protein